MVPVKHQYNPICAGDVTLKRQIAYATSIAIMQVCEHVVVNDYIKKCYPKDGCALSEPIVYRTDIENVLNNYKSKKRGLVVPEFIVKKLNKLE